MVPVVRPVVLVVWRLRVYRQYRGLWHLCVRCAASIFAFPVRFFDTFDGFCPRWVSHSLSLCRPWRAVSSIVDGFHAQQCLVKEERKRRKKKEKRRKKRERKKREEEEEAEQRTK